MTNFMNIMPPIPELFDSHCHLDFPEFDHDRDETLEQCWLAGVRSICIPATEARYWSRVLKQVNYSPDSVRRFVSLGLHPYFLKSHRPQHLDELKVFLKRHSETVCAVGEIGLDFSLTDSDRQQQHYYFIRQLELADQFKLPVILHCRKAHDEILKEIRQIKPERGGIVHAFSGSEQQAQQYIELGFKLGFGGTITYQRARKTRQLAASLPLSSIVLETDAPDMPMSGYQGQRNTPTLLPVVLEHLAQLRSSSTKEIAQATTENALSILAK
ncbi:TatD family hydrolase [Endozoicomonas sp. 8E]|uniref:TatD family hydrolase n=1 Tax=Endozoicomonas sp. 8E TaxID=3035692 RepID=UPI002938E8B6|nr:TatD family hydrolase [Endozoicomonas sp. 8E]WOG26458.1 TatD family hydrolase [Endozoicomonas sp. 8E]